MIKFLASAQNRRVTQSFRNYNPVSDFRLYFVILEVIVNLWYEITASSPDIIFTEAVVCHNIGMLSFRF